jgi:hypothetical protein
MRYIAAALLLLLQVVSVVHARFVPSRWLAWAPNDYAIGYKMQVHIQGRALSAAEIGKRYSLLAEGVYENPAQNMIDIIRQNEQTYGRKENAEVELAYRPNGGPVQEWQWPEK